MCSKNREMKTQLNVTLNLSRETLSPSGSETNLRAPKRGILPLWFIFRRGRQEYQTRSGSGEGKDTDRVCMCVCVCWGGEGVRWLHHRKQSLHPPVECDPLALDQMLLRPEYHEASVLRATHCSALHGPSEPLREGKLGRGGVARQKCWVLGGEEG